MDLLIEKILNIVQIVFYLTIAAVTILTYLRAKSTLLSSINTEYHKYVIQVLENVSNSLFSEFDMESESYWSKVNDIDEAVSAIDNYFENNKEGILSAGEYVDSSPIGVGELRIFKMISRYKSDPFLPECIRVQTVDFLENRLRVYQLMKHEVLDSYRNALAKGLYNNSLGENSSWISNQVTTLLYERGCGVSQNEEAVHLIRLEIKKYLEQFNPLRNN